MKVLDVFVAVKVYNKRVLYTAENAHLTVVEVSGEMSTTLALSEFAEVHISSDDSYLIPQFVSCGCVEVGRIIFSG